MKTWTKTRYQGLLRHRGGTYYARLYVAGKEKWLCLETNLIEIAKAKLEREKTALAEAAKTGWEPQAGTIQGEAAIKAYREDLKLRVGIPMTRTERPQLGMVREQFFRLLKPRFSLREGNMIRKRGFTIIEAGPIPQALEDFFKPIQLRFGVKI